MSNIANSGNFLRTSRNFPTDPQALSVELSKTYIDIANEVNNRTSGIYGVNSQIITSESWFLNGEGGRQFSLRQVYTFSDSNLVFNHNLNLAAITNFTRIYGTFYDGTFWNTLPYVDVTAANNQINVQIGSAQIIITKGAGSPPAISSGILVLEWISQV